MAYPKIEIKTDGEAPSIFTAIYVDGHKLEGVRRFELKQELGNSLPILTVDLMALNLATDLRVLKMNHYGMGEIEDIVWKKEERSKTISRAKSIDR